MMKKNLLPLLVTVILIFTVVPAVFAAGSSEKSEPGNLEKAPVQENSAQEIPQGEPEKPDGYPPEGWVEDFNEAYRIAQAENKAILLNFTGSDWCPWCFKLRDEVFETAEFKAYAKENLVLLFLDFPSRLALPEQQMRHNASLQALLGVEGYPTVWVIGPNLEPYIRTGYQAGGAEAYIKHLENDRFELTSQQISDFQKGFKEGLEQLLGPLE